MLEVIGWFVVAWLVIGLLISGWLEYRNRHVGGMSAIGWAIFTIAWPVVFVRWRM